jgi:hypothetical protein
MVANKAQRTTISRIERRADVARIFEVVDGGYGHVCVTWIELDGSQWQALLSPTGAPCGFDRQIWC